MASTNFDVDSDDIQATRWKSVHAVVGESCHSS